MFDFFGTGSQRDPRDARSNPRRRSPGAFGRTALLAPIIRMLVGGRAASVLLIVAALMYTAWPLDVLPDFIPGLGQADDLFALLLAVGNAWRAFSAGRPIETTPEGDFDRRR